MFVVIVDHEVVPERLQEAETTIMENGRRMRTSPGFVSRQTLRSRGNPLKITTVTCWQREEDREAWSQTLKRLLAGRDISSFWSKTPEAEVFDIIPEL